MKFLVLVEYCSAKFGNIFDLLEDDILILGRPGGTFTKTSGDQGENQDVVDVHDDAKQLRKP